MKFLSLGANQLSGTIPPEIGSLNHLIDLEMSANVLTGPIPSWLYRTTHEAPVCISPYE